LSIHSDHPFATPAAERDPARRFRGRLAVPVTVWTSGDERERAGLTVSSTIVAEGEPPLLYGLLGPDSDLWERFEETGRAVVNVLRWEHRVVADVFAGLHPSPGGMFRTGEWDQAESGPRLRGASAYATVRLREARQAGWSLLVETEIAEVVLPDDGGDDDALLYLRGRYRRPAPAGGSRP
jgi:flavin reductase (DIM6/NTAB) family NADH-FMN oxidoreductase RutF